MNNGCLCCTVRGDLVRILGELKDRRQKGELAFERVIIETTGMADPGPVAQTFFIDDAIGDYYLLDSVITVVDAKHAPKQLDEFEEAQEQVGFADRILLSKTDLVSDEDAATLKRRLGQMNPRAPMKPVHFGADADRRHPRHPRLQPERDPRDRARSSSSTTTTITTTRCSRSSSVRRSRSTG